jgi:tripartite motif-containing protein 2/3
MISTLIETININTDIFTDNFLTCPTCFGPYDENEHAPKLLPCSHTLCRSCLERISATAVSYNAISVNQLANQDQLIVNINNSSSSNSIVINDYNTLSRSVAAADAAYAAINNFNIANTSNSNSSSNIANQQTYSESFISCPICRETIILPRLGVNAFPPSFIINQLLDLMKNKKRDLIPRCSNHSNEVVELLFCETCDIVFCSICESHFKTLSNADHIVIPYSIAMKRMTEIFLFKSNQCINCFSLSIGNIQREIENLNKTTDEVIKSVDSSFKELKSLMDKRRDEILKELCKIKESKMSVLHEQIKLITNEKYKVETECKDYHRSNIECRQLSSQIQSLNEKLDSLRSLCEPRENSFINYEYKFNNVLQDTEVLLRSFGKFKVSSTYPPLSYARILHELNSQDLTQSSLLNTSLSYPANLKLYIFIQCVDYFGKKRCEGGDPFCIHITDPIGVRQTYTSPQTIKDNSNGTYMLELVPKIEGKYKIDVEVFSRPINQMPLYINAVKYVDSIWTFGQKANADSKSHSSFITSTIKKSNDFEFNMPVCVRVFENLIFILDSGNSRIKVLNTEGSFLYHIYHEGLNEASSTSLSLYSSPKNTDEAKSKCNLVTINWRLKVLSDYQVDIFEQNINRLQTYQLADPLQEPINIMETFSSLLYIIQDKNKLHLCDGHGKVVYESLDTKLKNECGLKNVTAFCGNPIAKSIYVADSTNASSLYEVNLNWLCDEKLDSILESLSSNKKETTVYYFYRNCSFSNYKKFTLNRSNEYLNIDSLKSPNPPKATQTQTKATKGMITALWYDKNTKMLLAAKTDKQKTVIEVYNSELYCYEYSIETSPNEKCLKRVTSMCSTDNGKIVCVDLIQNIVKMFRFI